MAITIGALRTASTRFRVDTFRARILGEARAQGLKTVFLCHSHFDEQLVKGLLVVLQDAGWRVYVDWADTSMPDTPDQVTATRIKQKIVEHDLFLFLATANSMTSRWCPWEIGYADGKKQIDQILILPTTDGAITHGNEYLELYQQIELSNMGKIGVWQPGQSNNGVLLENF